MNKQTVEFATVVKDKVIKQIGNSHIMQPKVNFKGGSIKWYEDKLKSTGKEELER